ncbi:Cyclic nucleotide-binding domain-containing protein [Actinomadura mexicana]|uniref:Cyclic nucleotide-binding domain-containing protein n=2 Tax=Actinomadura mexicana TaxID=134959 RepID=A0A239GUY2_9ACTN|nr:Cyclic nucleotide-binding domain-containing protein [Actinomadura mexicana]
MVGADESAALAVPQQPVSSEHGDDIIETMIGSMRPDGESGGMTLVVSFCREEPLAERYNLLKLVSDTMTASHPLRWYWTALNDADAFLLPIALADASLVGDVVRLLEQRLATFNAGQNQLSQLKVTLHAGMAALGFEANSPAPMLTKRLLGSKAVDRSLEQSPPTGLVMILPDWIFRGIKESRYDIGMHPKMFRQTYLPELSTVAWIYAGRSSGVDSGGTNGSGLPPARNQAQKIDRNFGASSDPQAGQAPISSGVFVMCVDSLDSGESFPQRSWAAVVYALQSAAFATGVALQEPRCFERNGYAVFAISALRQWEAASILPAVATRLRTSSAHTLPIRAGWVNMPDGAGSDLLADLALLAEPGDCGLRKSEARSGPRTQLAPLLPNRVLQRQTPLLLAVELHYEEGPHQDGVLQHPATGDTDDASVLYAMIHQALAAAARIWNPTTYETGKNGLLVIVQAPIWRSSELHELVGDLIGLVGRFNDARATADQVKMILALHGETHTDQDTLPNRQLMQLMQLIELARADGASRADLAVITSDQLHSQLRTGPYFSGASPVSINDQVAAWLAYLPRPAHDDNGRSLLAEPAYRLESSRAPRLMPPMPHSLGAGRTWPAAPELVAESATTPGASEEPPDGVATQSTAWRLPKSDDARHNEAAVQDMSRSAGPPGVPKEDEISTSSGLRPGFWQVLTAVERAGFLATAQEVVYPAGAVLWEEGQAADHAIVIKSGAVRVCVERDGRERFVAFRGPGDIIGERAALLLRQRSATVVAMDTLHGLRMPTQEFATYLSEHPRVVAVLEREVYGRLTEQQIHSVQDPQWTVAPSYGPMTQHDPPRSAAAASVPPLRLHDPDMACVPRTVGWISAAEPFAPSWPAYSVTATGVPLPPQPAQPVAAVAPSSGPPWAGQNCTVVLTDITGSSSRGRNDKDRSEVRRAMYTALQESFEEAGVPWDGCYSQDRGNGALIVVPPKTPTATVIDPVIPLLGMRLRRHNHRSSEAARVQLRVAVDVGPVLPEPSGVSGRPIITAARLLDAAPVRERLAATRADLGVITSRFVYDSVIAHSPGYVDADEYEPIRCQVKETDIDGWVYVPGYQRRSAVTAGAVLLGAGVRPPFR